MSKVVPTVPNADELDRYTSPQVAAQCVMIAVRSEVACLYNPLSNNISPLVN